MPEHTKYEMLLPTENETYTCCKIVFMKVYMLQAQ